MTATLLAEPTHAPGAEVFAERRRETRHPCPFPPPVRVRARSGYLPLAAFVADAAPSGLGLILKTRLEPGTLLDVELCGLGRTWPPVHPARVVHCTARPDGRWQVGCQLEVPLARQELDGLLRQARAPRS